MSQQQEQCKCCSCSSLLSLGITAVFLWLAYRPIVPRYYLVAFSLSSSSSSYYQLEIENKCWDLGVYHDDISLSLSLSLSPSPGGNLTSSIPSFYQGHKKTAQKTGSFTGGMVNPTNVFRVGLESGYRYKVWWWKTGHRGVSLACQVEVDASGKKTAEKGIRLTSSAAATLTKKKSVVVVVMSSLVLVVAVLVFILY